MKMQLSRISSSFLPYVGVASVKGVTAPLMLLSVLMSAAVLAQTSAQEQWRTETTNDGSQVNARSESGGVEVDGKLYAIGGRGPSQPVDVYDPVTRRWSTLGAAPQELHHFQPVAIDNLIYVIGALTGPFPTEPSVPQIRVLNTDTGVWSVAGQIPLNRRRGSTTAVLYQGEIYISGGNTKGHDGGAVAWFDKYDPATDTWTVLDDAPNARDHASGVVIGNKLYVAGGRRSDRPNVWDNPVLPVDIYDFSTGEWSTGRNIPTARAGAANVAVAHEVIVAGGEISGTNDALDDVEAYNTITDTWRRLADMKTDRHGASVAILGDRFHIAAGSGIRGGENLSTHESLLITSDEDADSDNDGLTDSDEINFHGTDPSNADSDNDGLNDGEEVELGTLPNDEDSDSDGLEDGVEVDDFDTDPLVADTDDDGLADGEEVELGTNPNEGDSDDDGLDDGVEVSQHQSDPLIADTDEDGLSDGAEVGEHGTDPLIADTDEDGLSDGAEVGEHGTDPLIVDTDDDQVSDGEEIAAGSNPLVADDVDDPEPGDDTECRVASNASGDGGEGIDTGTGTGTESEVADAGTEDGEGTDAGSAGEGTDAGTDTFEGTEAGADVATEEPLENCTPKSGGGSPGVPVLVGLLLVTLARLRTESQS